MKKEIISIAFLPGKIPVIILTLILIALSFSCEKEGPAGPRGETGAQGEKGAQGETGATGLPGSANVIYSEWFTPDDYTGTTVFGITNLDYNKAAPGITQEILDSGVILTYGKLSGYTTSIWPQNQVALLPIVLTYISGGSTQTDTWSSYALVGNLRISFLNNTNYYTSISTSHSFRYIIIPGGSDESQVKTTEKTISLSQVGSMTYDEVCEYLNIPY